MSTITYLWNKRFMPMPREIIVVRHAESTRNLSLGGRLFFETQKKLDLYSSESDPEVDISRTGEVQATKVGHILAKMGYIPDVVIHSGFLRTMRTADLILSKFPRPWEIPLVEIGNLRERRTGYTEHLTKVQIDQHFPWLKNHWDKNGLFLAVPIGGESFIEMTTGRIHQALQYIFKKYRGKKVMIIGHCGTNRCIHMSIENMSLCQANRFCHDETKFPKNCSVSRYQYDPKKTEW